MAAKRWEVPEALKKKWASIDDAADELKVSRDTIEKWRKDGRLQSRDYHGGHVLISRDSMKAMLAPYL